MPFLLLLILLLLFSPFLLVLLPFFLIGILLFLPFGFSIQAFLTLVTVPVEFYKIATNKRVRKNHAIEHATINVLEETGRYSNLSGLSKEDGFFIRGPLEPVTVERAARVALARLKNGETELVVHKRCGTTMATINFIAAITFIALLLITGYLSFLNVLLALVVATILGPILSPTVQKHITTSSDVHDMEIVGVHWNLEPLRYWGVRVIYPTDFFVETAQKGDYMEAELI
ncbi:MAG: hypothetical protein J7L41_06515 [Synergistetes bacterium]|nr:hypothetical protein [Synergistota bacterium]